MGDWSAPRNRRRFLRDSAGLAAGLSLAGVPALRGARAAGPLRKPDSLPDPFRAAGTPDASMPFDHVVVVMMENHSFDNYLGMLGRRGQPNADGFLFGPDGRPVDRQPYKDGYVEPLHAPSMCQPEGVDQSWHGSHAQINGGAMDGFPPTSTASMYYWDESDLPFYYSLAKTFTVGNRWFCSAPCQTFPNRRFMLACTADGLVSTDVASIFDPPPATGTIFDRLNAHGISWRNYFSNLPGTAIISSIVTENPGKVLPVTDFFVDAALGNLPAVSFVDSELGLFDDIIGQLGFLTSKNEQLADLATHIKSLGGDEENPDNIENGETFVDDVFRAVTHSPAWERILFVWTYDEHGGYYDHVPPPAALKPDDVAPRLGPKDPPGAFDRLGPRVPTVVASAYSKPNGVSNVVYDHTSIYATIAAKWNLPACTFRDANANTMMDFLDPKRAALREPPKLSGHGRSLSAELECDTSKPVLDVKHGEPRTRSRARP